MLDLVVMSFMDGICVMCVFTHRRKCQNYYSDAVSVIITTAKNEVIVTLSIHASSTTH
jgi:hypothetical protein